MQLRAKINRWDILLIAALVALFGLYIVRVFGQPVYPAEDAAMLLRYSKHVSEGYGIVWNIGDQPVDGATDFLFMVLVAFCMQYGLSAENSAQLVGSISHIVTIVVIYVSVRKIHNASYISALISGLYITFGPSIGYIQACFGTPLFAMFACFTWFFALDLINGGNINVKSLAFSLSGLALGLSRPEGVFLAFFMIVSIIYLKGWVFSRLTLMYFVSVFMVLGGAYFIWRWSYFGYPLPNPFYKKGGGSIYLNSLFSSFENMIFLGFPFIPVFILGILYREVRRRTIFSIIPIIGFVAIWVLLSNEMNYLMRFQYAVLPVILMSWPPLLKGFFGYLSAYKLNHENIKRYIIVIPAISMVIGVIIIYYSLYSIANVRDGRLDAAVLLKEYKFKGYTIATTEAGLLPFYSEWNAIDTWGLNDQWIAHNGGITDAYLERYKPHVIMLHIFPGQGAGWSAMVENLQGYAEKKGYYLAGVFGVTPANTHYYYVRPDFPDSTVIANRIQHMEYPWGSQKGNNYALTDPRRYSDPK